MRLALPLLLIATTALSACAPSAPPADSTAAASADHEHADEIAWRKGDVDDAFAEAKETGKPVLLYWGAVWCPPCNQLKAGLFKDKDFIALTQRYVPVYLDGDEEGAQAWGERFGVRGYPTLIVLDAQGSEITRIAGGNDAQALTRTLTSAVERRSAVADTLKQALAQPAALSAEDWQALADYGWEVDANRLADAKDTGPVLRRLAAAAPEPVQQHRFRLLALASDAQDPASATEVRELLQAVLGDAAQVRSNRDLLGWRGAALVQRASAGPATAARLGTELLQALERADTASGGSADDALSRVLTEIALLRQQQPQGPLPAPLVEKVRQQVQAVDAAATTPYQRQASISTAAYALREAGDDAAAEALLLAELDRSQTPYYYMPELAELAEARGDKVAAIDWLKRAYAGAQGPATRVQWGVLYVEGLLRLQPDDAAGIEQAATAVIAELDAPGGGYHQRTRQRFERLGSELQAWAGAHDGQAAVERLQARLQAHCEAGKEDCARWTVG